MRSCALKWFQQSLTHTDTQVIPLSLFLSLNSLQAPQKASEIEPREHSLRNNPIGDVRLASLKNPCDFEKDLCERSHFPRTQQEVACLWALEERKEDNYSGCSRDTARMGADHGYTLGGLQGWASSEQSAWPAGWMEVEVRTETCDPNKAEIGSHWQRQR